MLAFITMLILGDETINDFAGGSNFFILALVTLTMGGTYYARNLIVSIFVMVSQVSTKFDYLTIDRIVLSVGMGRAISYIFICSCSEIWWKRYTFR